MKQFYIYVHCRPNGEPFYVGKGCGQRFSKFSIRSKHHKNIVAKYSRENILIYVRDCESEQQAHEHEVWMIAWCRSQGFQLTNYTDGGEGSSGYRMSEETKNKLRSANTGKIYGVCPKERKEKISIAKKGKPNYSRFGKHHTPEARIKCGLKNIGRKDTEETRIKKSIAKLGNKNLLGHQHTLESRLKMSKSRIGNKSTKGQKWSVKRRAAYEAKYGR